MLDRGSTPRRWLVIILIVGLIPRLSALLIAIVIGAIAGIYAIVPPVTSAGISWGSKKFLRLSILLR